MPVVVDLLDGGTLTEDPSGYRVTRSYSVTGITGNSDARQFNALQAAGVPAFGAAHPSISGLFARARDVIAVGPTQFRVNVSYAPLEAGELADERTAAPGTLLSVRMNYETAERRRRFNKDNDDIVDDATNKRSVFFIAGQTVFEWSWITASLAQARANSYAYIGSVNAGIWDGHQPRTFLVNGHSAERIQGRTDGAVRENWTFVYRPDNWDHDLAFYAGGAYFQLTTLSKRVLPETDFSQFPSLV